MNRCPTGSGSRRRRAGSAASHEVDDLDLVAVADQRRGKRVALDDHHVVFDGNAPGIDVQPFEQFLHGHRLLEIVRVPVERNPHGRGLAEFYSTESGDWARRESERSIRSGRSERSLVPNDPNDPNAPNDLVRRRCRVLFLVAIFAVVELRSLHPDVDGDQ